MSRRVVAPSFGPLDQVVLVEVSLAPPGPGEVAVAVRAAGVNPIDAKRVLGAMGQDPAELPLVVGQEAAGTVTAVGTGAEGPAGPLAVGDEVVVHPVSGAWASDLVVPASSVLPLPAGLSLTDGAAVLAVGTTAHHGLEAAGVRAGDTLLLHGGSGGVGLSAVQQAVARGVRVVATASSRHHALLRELGAEPTTYGEGLADRVRALAPNGVAAALDAVGTDEAIDVSLALVDDPARVVSIAAFQRAGDGIVLLTGGTPEEAALRDGARLELLALAARGGLRASVTATYPLERAAEALAAVASGHTRGKIVLTVDRTG